MSLVAFWLGVSFDLFRLFTIAWRRAPGSTDALAVLVILAPRSRRARSPPSRRADEEALRTRRSAGTRRSSSRPAVTYTWDPTGGAGPRPSTSVRRSSVCSDTRPRNGLADVLDGASTPTTATAWSRHRRSDREGTSFREEYRSCAKDGRVVWLRDESEAVAAMRRPTRPDAGRDLRHHPQKEVEARPQEAENRFRTIVERVPAVAYVWDAADAPGTPPPRTSARRSNACSASPPRRGSRTRRSGVAGARRRSPGPGGLGRRGRRRGPVHGRVPHPAADGRALDPRRGRPGGHRRTRAPDLSGRDVRRDGAAGAQQRLREAEERFPS